MKLSKIEPKELPRLPRKSQIHRMYLTVSRKVLIHEINTIVSEHRKLHVDAVKNVQTLYHPEFVRLVKLFGIPKGYYAPEGFFDIP